MEWHQFALTLRIPSGREAEWERLLSSTPSPAGIRCTRRSQTVLLISVEAEMEFLAIERADQWLQSVAAKGTPAFRVGTNAQPAHEIDV